ncbi:MAG: hypothetical protein AAGI37_19505 [Planctomycetota bacterium]
MTAALTMPDPDEPLPAWEPHSASTAGMPAKYRHQAPTLEQAIGWYRLMLDRSLAEQTPVVHIPHDLDQAIDPAIVCGGWNISEGLDKMLALMLDISVDRDRYVTVGDRPTGVRVFVLGTGEATLEVRPFTHCYEWDRQIDSIDVRLDPYNAVFGREFTVVSYSVEVMA